MTDLLAWIAEGAAERERPDEVRAGKVFGNAISETGPAAAGGHEFDTRLDEVDGRRVLSRARNLDRHWRNLRTITLHNPASYKAAAVGRHLVTGDPLPVNGYF